MPEGDPRWAGKRVLVIGCTGLLGRAVTAELLARGAQIVGLVRNRTRGSILARQALGRVHIVYGCVENGFRLYTTMAIHEVTAVFHLAAVPAANENQVDRIVFEAARLHSPDMPVVVARPLTVSTLEPDPPLSVARFDVVFGPGDRAGSRTVPATATALIAGLPIPLPTDGPPRDFVFVNDAADACLRVAEATLSHGPGKYTFRSGWSLTNRQMAAAMADTFAGRSPTLPKFTPVMNPLGWQPRESFVEALSRTLKWYCAGQADVFRPAELQNVA